MATKTAIKAKLNPKGHVYKVENCNFTGINFDKSSMEIVNQLLTTVQTAMIASQKNAESIAWSTETLSKIADLFKAQNINIETLLNLGPNEVSKDPK